jgi:hypothetical protein
MKFFPPAQPSFRAMLSSNAPGFLERMRGHEIAEMLKALTFFPLAQPSAAAGL